MKKAILILILFLSSCLENKSTFNSVSHLDDLGVPTRIEYYLNRQNALSETDSARFVIRDSIELKIAIDEIKNAGNKEPWKGAGWNRLKIYFPDTTYIFLTNNKKLGTSSSGFFYDLPTDNFITKRIHR